MANVEEELKRLRKVPENKVCPNCLKPADFFGFTSVCVPYRTFLCDLCKSAHQSFSHRCKSTSMSTWTMEEVRQLDERGGGGNKVAMANMLAGVPEGARPAPGSHHTVYKNFIEKAYISKVWEGTTAAGGSSSQSQPPKVPAVRQSRAAAKEPASAPSVKASPHVKKPTISVAQPAAVNLLDFDDALVVTPNCDGDAAFKAAGQNAQVVQADLFDSLLQPAPSSSKVGSFPSEPVGNVNTCSAFSFIGQGQQQGGPPPLASASPPVSVELASALSFDPFGAAVPQPEAASTGGLGAGSLFAGLHSQNPSAMQYPTGGMSGMFAPNTNACTVTACMPQAAPQGQLSSFSFIGSSSPGPVGGMLSAPAYKAGALEPSPYMGSGSVPHMGPHMGFQMSAQMGSQMGSPAFQVGGYSFIPGSSVSAPIGSQMGPPAFQVGGYSSNPGISVSSPKVIVPSQPTEVYASSFDPFAPTTNERGVAGA